MHEEVNQKVVSLCVRSAKMSATELEKVLKMFLDAQKQKKNQEVLCFFQEVIRWFRVRKNWADAKSQKGAYKILDNAKKCADKNPMKLRWRKRIRASANKRFHSLLPEIKLHICTVEIA